jgi:hypothetical protein
MTEPLSYEIYVLGLLDPSPDGRARYVEAMEHLTGKPSANFEGAFPKASEPAFRGLERARAREVANVLGQGGVFIDVRPRHVAPDDTGDDLMEEPDRSSRNCPACGLEHAPGAVECEQCGLVFAKHEREQILKMQREQALEEALTKALQVREEWLHRAKKYLEGRPFPADGSEGFDRILVREEVPFQRLVSEEGPILMTSRRMIAEKEEVFHSIPYEMVGDVDFGGGLVTKKGRVRMVLTFHSPLPLTTGEAVKSMTWQLDKESSFYKDVIMDWSFSRNFICGACGERDLQYRTEGNKVRMRCMHCATDHEIDLREAVAVPIIKDVQA